MMNDEFGVTESLPKASRTFFAPEACCFRDSGSVSPITIPLSSEESHHTAHVLRLRVGERIRLFDGAGYFYGADISEIRKRQVLVSVHSFEKSDAEPRVHLSLLAGFLKGHKNDLIIQKAVELGVSEILFFAAGRSIGRRDAVQDDNAKERINRIVISACKQCGRAGLMPVRSFPSIEAAMASLPDLSLRFAFWEGESGSPGSSNFSLGGATQDIKAAGPQAMPVCALIGPEGGMSEQEMAMIRNAGFVTCSLGSRILRAETAALAACAILLNATGELGTSFSGLKMA